MFDADLQGGGSWCITGLLVKIARDHFRAFQTEQGEAQRLRLTKPTTEDEALVLSWQISERESAACEQGLVVVVFAAFAIESHINEYGSRRLGSQYYERFVDKLDTLSKWIIVPRLVSGTELPRERRAFQLLTELFRWRNTIAHPKAKPFNPDTLDEDAPAQIARRRAFLEFVPLAIQVLDELGREAEGMDPSDPLFFSGLAEWDSE
jgi:hypothetical protein